MRTQLLPTMMLAFVISACAAREHTIVRVSDPSRVSLQTDSLETAEVVLPEGNDPETARAATFRRGSVTATRDGAGGISLRCSPCIGASPVPILRSDGQMVGHGDAARVVTDDGDVVRVRVAASIENLATSDPTDATGSWNRRAYFQLVTPKDNVLSKETKYSSTVTPGILVAASGLAVATLGGVALAASRDAPPSDPHHAVLVTSGVVGLLLGGVATTTGIVTALPRSREMAEGPRE